MKQALTGLFLGLALAWAAVPAAAAPSCRIPGGQILATGRLAKLIAVPTPSGRALYACIRRSGRKLPLDDGFSDARLAGRWVAWQRASSGEKWRLVVHDLRTGKERLVIGHVAAHSLVLTTRGSIAWAQRVDTSAATPLYANEPGRSGRLLDGGDVAAGSVALEDRRVTWISGGVERSALLR